MGINVSSLGTQNWFLSCEPKAEDDDHFKVDNDENEQQLPLRMVSSGVRATRWFIQHWGRGNGFGRSSSENNGGSFEKSLYSQWFPWGLDIMTLNVVHGLWRLISNTYLCSEETRMMKKRRLYSLQACLENDCALKWCDSTTEPKRETWG